MKYFVTINAMGSWSILCDKNSVYCTCSKQEDARRIADFLNTPTSNTTDVKYKFKLDEIVLIIALDLTGRVIGLWTGKRGNEIEVRFCANSEYKNVYFFEDELVLPTEKHKIKIY